MNKSRKNLIQAWITTILLQATKVKKAIITGVPVQAMKTKVTQNTFPRMNKIQISLPILSKKQKTFGEK